MNTQSIAKVYLNSPEEYVLEAKRKTKVVEPNYFKIGNGTMNKHGMQAIDLINELIGCSKPAQTILGKIKDGMVWNPLDKRIEFVVLLKAKTNAEKQVIKKGYKELHAKDLVRRVKRGYYMINPNALITNYDAQYKVWNSCK